MKSKLMLFIMLAFFVTEAQNKNNFELPVLITSAGQSADAKLAGVIFKKAGIQATSKLMAKNEDLNGIKTLVVVPGFSSKGLGAAGISAEEELARVKALLKTAADRKIPVLLMHLGGNARRKGQSDNFNKMVGDIAKYMIVVKQGNEDGFFTDIAKAKNCPMSVVEKMSDAGEPLENLFVKK